MKLTDFHFHLPPEQIAQYPLAERSASRLCYLAGTKREHRQFRDVVDYFQPGDLLVLNDTKVFPARLLAHKPTGGKVELLIERVIDEQHVLVQLKASKKPKVGDTFILPGETEATLTVQSYAQPFYTLQSAQNIWQTIDAYGQIPLPPYMRRSAEASDRERYQTIYAKYRGSVAAPTAGFHFDDALFTALKARQVEIAYVTLHIGAGTFLPVRSDNILEHKMHTEYCEVSDAVCAAIKQAKRVIAVGTTTLRALETASLSGTIKPFHGETNLFIYPGFKFNVVEHLITNLHLPSSTLLMLVCAFAGTEDVLSAYREMVQLGYRFYSYGDVMWLTKSACSVK